MSLLFPESCPACSYTLDFGEGWRFVTWYGTRRPAPCPRCGLTLKWAPWPFRVATLGACTAILGLIAEWVVPKASIYNWLAILTLMLGLALKVFGDAKTRLEELHQ